MIYIYFHEKNVLLWSDLPTYFQCIQQSNNNGWVNFVLLKGNGFTQPGIQRINESIRAYVCCVLGAQAQTRCAIVKDSSTSFDTQKQFLVILEDTIDPVIQMMLPISIKRNEDIIATTRSRLNYVIAPDLYMMPADIVLKMGTVRGYKNNITVATRAMVFGINYGVNSERPQPKMAPALAGKPSTIKRAVDSSVPPVTKYHMTPAPPPPTKPFQSHSDNKIYIVITLGSLVGLSVTYFEC
jgi:hypothetical protein